MFRDQFPGIDQLRFISKKKSVQKVIGEIIFILNEEWLKKLRFPSFDAEDENGLWGLLGLLANLNLNDNPTPTITSTPLDQQFGFINDQQNKILLNMMTVKHAYNRLLEKQLSLFLRRRKISSLYELKASFWENIWNTLNLPWELIWISCFNIPVNNKKKELSWKIFNKAICTVYIITNMYCVHYS